MRKVPTWLAGWAPAMKLPARLRVVLGYRNRWAMMEQCGSTPILPKSDTSLCPKFTA